MSAHKVDDWAERLSANPGTITLEELYRIRKQAGDVLFTRALEQFRQEYRRKMLASSPTGRGWRNKTQNTRVGAMGLGTLVARMGAVLLSTGNPPGGQCIATRLVAYTKNVRKAAQLAP